jgi:hypothetical protein
MIPAKLSYVEMGEGGNKSSEKNLFTAAKSREEMEAEGYKLVEIQDDFLVGEATDGLAEGNYIVFCGEIPGEKQERVKELLEESKKMGLGTKDDRIFMKKVPKPFVTEFFSVDTFTSDDGQDKYYAVTYAKQGIVFSMLSSVLMSRMGYWFLLSIPFQIIVPLGVALIVGLVKNGKRKKEIMQ